MMKKLVVLLAVAMLVGATTVSAKKLPAVAAKVSADFKQEIVDQINYPAFERNNLIEGTVWMKFTLDENSKVEVVELSSTDQGLGEHVKTEMSDFYAKNSKMKAGDIYYLKVKFNLNKEL